MSDIASKEIENMKRLINFGSSDTVTKIDDKPILEYHKKGADGNIYGIVKECNKYYIKRALPKDTEPLAEDYEYIDGINNKKDYEYSSYAMASKQFGLKMMSLNEAYESNKQPVQEEVTKSVDAEWQINETKEMRAEINRFNEITNNVSKILGESSGDGFTVSHTLPEAPAKNPSDKKVNTPFTDTAVAKGDKDFKESESDYKKAGKPFDKDGTISDGEMQSDKKKSGEKGEVYTEKAKYVPDNSVADKNPSGSKPVKVDEAKKRVVKVTQKQVLAWRDDPDYMDKSNGTQIGDTAPYTEKCCAESKACGKKVNESFGDDPQTPEEVEQRVHSLRSNMIGLENGDAVYFDYDPSQNVLYAGGATNAGIVRDYTMEYDFDYSFDQNLQEFVEQVDANLGMEEESCGKKGKKVNEEQIDVNDVAGMPDDEDGEDVPFPEAEEYDDADEEDDDEWGFADEEPFEEARKRGKTTVNEEMVLNDFGKHPAYRKAPMTLPANTEPSKVGHEWDDDSVKGERPYGSQIGSNAPYDQLVDVITDALIKRLGGGVKKKSN